VPTVVAAGAGKAVGKDAALQILAKGFLDIRSWGVVLAVAVELTGTCQIEPSLEVLGYESAARFWKTTACDDKGLFLGEKALRGLKTSQIMTAIASRPDLSGKTINNYRQVLCEALELAVTDKILTENPALKVPRAKHQKEPADPFSRDEMETILADIQCKQDCQVHNFTEFWFWSGLRTSEIFGLQWNNVDPATGTMLVTEAVARGIHKDSTKTNVARTVRLNSRSLAAVQRQRQHTQIAGTSVFHDPRYGTPMGGRARIPTQLLDAHTEIYWNSLSATLQHAPHLRHGDVNVRHEVGILRNAAGPQRGNVPQTLRKVASWSAGRP
jgi:integrase